MSASATPPTRGGPSPSAGPASGSCRRSTRSSTAFPGQALPRSTSRATIPTKASSWRERLRQLPAERQRATHGLWRRRADRRAAPASCPTMPGDVARDAQAMPAALSRHRLDRLRAGGLPQAASSWCRSIMRPWLWSWPDGFINRMRRVSTEVFVVGRYDGRRFLERHRQRRRSQAAWPHWLARPAIWTNRIDRIAPSGQTIRAGSAARRWRRARALDHARHRSGRVVPVVRPMKGDWMHLQLRMHVHEIGDGACTPHSPRYGVVQDQRARCVTHDCHTSSPCRSCSRRNCDRHRRTARGHRADLRIFLLL